MITEKDLEAKRNQLKSVFDDNGYNEAFRHCYEQLSEMLLEFNLQIVQASIDEKFPKENKDES